MTKISSARVMNYKSIEDTGGVNLSGEITTLIGANASGKTSFLEAISLIGNNKSINQEQVSAYTDGDTSELEEIKISAVSFKELSFSQFPYIKGLCEPAGVNTRFIKNILESNEFENKHPLSEGNFGNNMDKTIFVRYGSGKHTILFGAGIDSHLDCAQEHELKDLIGTHISYLEEIADYIADSNLPLIMPDLSEDIDQEKDSMDTLQSISEALKNLDSDMTLEELEDELNIGALENLIQDVDRILRTKTELNQIQNSYGEILPEIFDNLKMPLAPGEFSADEKIKSPYSALFREASLDDTSQSNNYNTELEFDKIDKESLDPVINQFENDLTELFNGFWNIPRNENTSKDLESASVNEFSIGLDIDDDAIKLYLSDGEKDHVPFKLESEGTRWLLSFLTAIYTQIRGNILDQDGIIVLDDPGATLHPDFLQRIYRLFEKYSENAQIIYSTHSPFLIDQHHTERVRIIRRDDTNTKMMTLNNYEPPKDETTIDILAPIRIELGASIGDYPFGGLYNLLVEGGTDILYINTVNKLLDKRDETTLKSEINIISTSGKNEGKIISLLDQERQNFIILKDDDEDINLNQYRDSYLFLQDTQADDVLRHKIVTDFDETFENPRELPDETVSQYDNVDLDRCSGLHNYDIEELMIKPLIFETLGGLDIINLSRHEWKEKISRHDTPLGKSIKIIAREEYKRNQSDYDCNNKEKFAALVKGKLASDYCDTIEEGNHNVEDDKFDLMLERFVSLFDAINELFDDNSIY